MKTIRDMPEVRPGQLWADNDPRCAGRTLRVDEVRYRTGGQKVARCTILTNADDVQRQLDDPRSGYRGRDQRGRQTEISVRRFRPTSTGYQLVTRRTEGWLSGVSEDTPPQEGR